MVLVVKSAGMLFHLLLELFWDNVYIYVLLCMHVCMYVCMYVRTYAYISVLTSISANLAEVLEKRGNSRPDINAESTMVRPASALMVLVTKMTALHTASETGCLDCAKLLLSHGANKEARMSLKGFPKMFDTEFDLWMYKAMNDVQKKGETRTYPSLVQVRPIHLAAKHGCCDCIELLIMHHADVDDAMVLAYEHNYYNKSNEDRSHVATASFMGADACFIRPLDLALAYSANTDEGKVCVKNLLLAGAATDHIVVDAQGELLEDAGFLKRLEVVNATANATPQVTKCKHWTLNIKTKGTSPGLLIQEM